MSGSAGLFSVGGQRISGQSIRSQNVLACAAVANIVKSSLGPVGLDKMLVDDVGDVTVTNDGASILRLLEVQHPAAKVLVDLAQLQDDEVGDGTTSVVSCFDRYRCNQRPPFQLYLAWLTSRSLGYKIRVEKECLFALCILGILHFSPQIQIHTYIHTDASFLTM